MLSIAGGALGLWPKTKPAIVLKALLPLKKVLLLVIRQCLGPIRISIPLKSNRPLLIVILFGGLNSISTNIFLCASRIVRVVPINVISQGIVV